MGSWKWSLQGVPCTAFESLDELQEQIERSDICPWFSFTKSWLVIKDTEIFKFPEKQWWGGKIRKGKAGQIYGDRDLTLGGEPTMQYLKIAL